MEGEGEDNEEHIEIETKELLYAIIKAIRGGSIYTLPPYHPPSPPTTRLPAALKVYSPSGDPIPFPPTCDAGEIPISWGGISFSPSPHPSLNMNPTTNDDSTDTLTNEGVEGGGGGEGYDSYNNERMEFYVQPVRGGWEGRQAVNVISPVSGSMTYVNRGSIRGWEGKDDGHKLEGLIVRDCMRVFGGVLDL